ncbi:MAG: OmpH family outer membrane protein [Xanthomonadaceae bacterium]|jgi:outer membrane protein|nr:OmpH family outer membrane protein [Xanthomonadaceae bacterium]
MPTTMPTTPAQRRRRAARAGAVLRGALLALCCAVGATAPREAASQAAPAQGARIAYVDMKRLLDNAPQVQAGREALAREFAQRDADLKAQEARLVEMEQRQRREGALLPKAESDARQAEIDTLRRSIERLRTRLREELNGRNEQELKKRWDEVHDEVVNLARERQYDLVVPSPVIYASPTIDITDEVLERLRRKAAGQAP